MPAIECPHCGNSFDVTDKGIPTPDYRRESVPVLQGKPKDIPADVEETIRAMEKAPKQYVPGDSR